MACCSPKCRAIFMMCYGVVGVVVGLLVGGIFLLHPQLRNVHGGSWGLVSFLFAACASVYGLLRWKCWPCLSRATMLFVVVGAGGTALGTVMFILYIVLGATDNGGKSLVESFYIPSVWCFMTFKWSMLLLSNAITDDRSPKDTDIGSIQEGPEGDDSMVPP